LTDSGFKYAFLAWNVSHMQYKTHGMYTLIFVKYLEKEIYTARKWINGCLASEWEQGLTKNRHEEYYLGEDKVLKLNCHD
jgi:hypothetical protein